MWPLRSKEDKSKQIAANAAKEWDEKIRPLLANTNLEGVRGRSAVGRYLSGRYDGSDRLHQIYQDFGYPDELSFDEFFNMYRRFGMAKAIVDTIVDVCWVDAPKVEGSAAFNSELEKLAKKIPLWNRLKGLDLRQRVGAYAGLFIQVADDLDPRQPMQRVQQGIDSIVNLKPIYEGQLLVSQHDAMGNPTMYQFQPSVAGSRNPDETSTTNIHPSRIIPWAEDADDGSIYGISAIECVYNDLMDLRKISGASAEGGYQNSRSIPVFKADANFQAPSGDDKKEFDGQIEDWLNKWRKRLVVRGLEPMFNNVTIPNPKETYQASLNNIAAGSKLPQAALTGQITGVLAGDKDMRSLNVRGNSRRQNFLTEGVSDFIDWCIQFGVLPASEYEIDWSDLLAVSDEEKLKNAESMATINKTQFESGGDVPFSGDEIRETAGFEAELEEEPGGENLDDEAE